ncbi:MAG: DUF3782 domain-containing protein [Candidatus Thorarchaeota archaeon]
MTTENVDSRLVEQLIKVLEENPKLRARMAQLFSPFEFVKRDELAEVLKEIAQLRKEQGERFEALQKQMDERFEESNRRFEALQKQMDERFEESNRRFEALQKQMDERFEESNRRFEALQKQIDERFEAMQRRMDERFEESDRRFEALQAILVTMQADIADISGKYGKRAEDAARKLLTKVLEAEGVETARIEHIQVKDKDGSIFGLGYTTDIDIYYEGKETWAIEYKARTHREDLIHLHLVARLLREQYKINPDKIVMVTLNINDEAMVLAKDLGIQVIKGVTANPLPISVLD